MFPLFFPFVKPLQASYTTLRFLCSCIISHRVVMGLSWVACLSFFFYVSVYLRLFLRSVCELSCTLYYDHILRFMLSELYHLLLQYPRLLPNKLAACEREWIVTVDDQELTF